MLSNPLGHRLGDGLDAALLKGGLEAGGLAQFGVTGGAAPAAEAQIPLPCVGVVGLVQQEELQSGHGGQTVINIIEGTLINVELTLPAGAAAVEGQAVKVDPGTVFLFQLEPDIVPLVGGQVGVLVHDVLELVHSRRTGR